jgi:hypothetical protein
MSKTSVAAKRRRKRFKKEGLTERPKRLREYTIQEARKYEEESRKKERVLIHRHLHGLLSLTYPTTAPTNSTT